MPRLPLGTSAVPSGPPANKRSNVDRLEARVRNLEARHLNDQKKIEKLARHIETHSLSGRAKQAAFIGKKVFDATSGAVKHAFRVGSNAVSLYAGHGGAWKRYVRDRLGNGAVVNLGEKPEYIRAARLIDRAFMKTKKSDKNWGEIAKRQVAMENLKRDAGITRPRALYHDNRTKADWEWAIGRTYRYGNTLRGVSNAIDSLKLDKTRTNALKANAASNHRLNADHTTSAVGNLKGFHERFDYIKQRTNLTPAEKHGMLKRLARGGKLLSKNNLNALRAGKSLKKKTWTNRLKEYDPVRAMARATFGNTNSARMISAASAVRLVYLLGKGGALSMLHPVAVASVLSALRHWSTLTDPERNKTYATLDGLKKRLIDEVHEFMDRGTMNGKRVSPAKAAETIRDLETYSRYLSDK